MGPPRGTGGALLTRAPPGGSQRGAPGGQKTFFLSLDPKVGLERTLARYNKIENRFENMGLSYHQKIQDGFKVLCNRNNKRFVKINADLSIEKISNKIYNHVISIIKSND